MEIKLCMLLAIIMFALMLIIVGLVVFFTLRLEKAYVYGLGIKNKKINEVK